MIYLDTSALIKFFVVEKGSVLVADLVRRRGPTATATIAYAEVYSGLTRRLREGYCSKSQYLAISRQFEKEWVSFIRVELGDEVLGLARDLIRRYPLRAFDAIHLASTLTLKTGLQEDLTFVAADSRLLRAATEEGLDILNIEND